MGASIHSLYFALKFLVENTLEKAATKSETQLLQIPPTALVDLPKMLRSLSITLTLKNAIQIQ